MSIASQGSSVTLSAQFYDPHSTSAMDPSTLQFQILYDDPSNPATPGLTVGPIMAAGLTRTGLGVYQYTWAVPTNIVLGDYQVQWVAIVNGVSQFNVDVVHVVAPSAADQTTISSVDLSSDPHIIVNSDNINVKFDLTPRASSVYQASYVLFKVQGSSYSAIDYDAIGANYDYDSAFQLSGDPGATNAFVSGPFLPIQRTDYNSISRVLTLNFASQLTANAQYLLVISGIIDAAGMAAGDLKYLFSVPANVIPNVIPIETPILVEDHSVLQTPFTSLDVISEVNPGFYIASTDPATDNVFLDPGYKNGRTTITFSNMPASTYINSTYFQVQAKPLSRGFSRWINISSAQITADNSLPRVYIDMPSGDATPVYNQPGINYYQDNYKYRIKISSVVAASAQPSSDNLGEDQYISFMINPSPFLVDPDAILPYFPDVPQFEIAELIYDASQEIIDFFDNGDFTQPITPTITSTMQDFVIADVLCNLTRIYDFGGGSNALSVTLGDLTVNQGNSAKTMVNRSTATTWCELAGIIRNEIYNLSSKSGMKAVVKGSRYWNPMPKRRIQYQEWRSWGNDRDSSWQGDDHLPDNGAEWRQDWS